MTGAAEGSPARTHRWRRRLWKIGRIAAIALAAVLALLLVVPAALTVLPLEGPVERRLASALGSDVTLRGFRVGWFRPLRIGELRIAPPGSATDEPLLLLEDLRIEGGLLRLGMSSNRPIRISLERLEVNVRRDMDGNLNLPVFPDAGDEAPVPDPPDPDAPLDIRFANLIPAVPLPFGSIDVHAREIAVRWTDEGDPGASAAFEEGSFTMRWQGGAMPLVAELPGVVRTPRGAVPVHMDAQAVEWRRDGHFSPQTFRLLLTASAAGEEGFSFLLQGEETGLVSIAQAEAEPWLPLAALFAEEAPPVAGRLGLTLSGKSRAGGMEELSLSAELAGVEPPAANGAAVVLPPVDLALFTSFPGDPLERESSVVRLRAGNAAFNLTEELTPEGLHHSAWTLDLPLGGFVELGRQLLPGAGIPALEAALSGEGQVRLYGAEPRSATAAFGWTADAAEWDEPLPALEGLAADPARLPLSFTDATAILGWEAAEDGGWTAHAEVESRLFEAAAEAVSGAAGAIEGSGALRLWATELLAVRDEAFPGLMPEAGAEGAASAELHFEVDGAGEELAASGSWRFGPWTATLAGDPGIVYTDEWSGRWSVDGTLPASFDLAGNWQSRFQEFDFSARLGGPFPVHAEWSQTLRLSDLAAAIPPAFAEFAPMVPEGVLVQEGTLDLSEGLEAVLAWRGGSEGELLLPVVEGLDMPLSIAADASARVRPEGDGWVVPEASASLMLEDWLSAVLEASLPRPEPDNLRASLGVDMQWGPVLEWAAPAFEWFELGGVLATGVSRLDLNAEGIQFVAVTITTEIDELLHESEALYAGAIGLSSVQDAELFLARDGTFEAGFHTTGTIAETVVNDQLILAGISWDLAHWFDGATNRQELELRHAGWEMLEFLGGEGLALALPELALRIRAAHDGDAGAFELEELTLRGTNWMDVALRAAGNTGTEEYSADIDRAALSLEGIELQLSPDLPVEWSGTLCANGSFVFAPAPDLPIPFAEFLRLEASWEDLEIALPPGTALRELGGSVRFDADPMGAALLFSNRLGFLEMEDFQAAWATPTTADLELYYDDSGDLYIHEGRLALESAGTELFLRGRLDGIRALAGEPAEEDVPMAARFLGLPGEFFLGHRQDVSGLSVFDAIGDGAGNMESWLRVEYRPEAWLRVGFDQVMQDVRLDWGGEVILDGMNAQFEHFSEVHAPDRAQLNQHLGSGRYFFPETQLRYPGISTDIEEFLVLLDAEGPEFGGSFQGARFFGGTARGALRVGLSGDDPELNASFSITGIDGAIFFPRLMRRPPGSRNMDTFGTLQLRIPENPSIRGLLDQLFLRMEITALSTDLLREMLLMMDKDGGHPGIQATVAATRFGSPRRGSLEVRGGLLNIILSLSTPTGVGFTIPLFERASMATLLDAWIPRVDDAAMEFFRVFLRLILASDLDQWTQLIEGAPDPT